MAQLTCQNLCVGYDGKSVLQDLNFDCLALDIAVFSGRHETYWHTVSVDIALVYPAHK